MKLTSRLLCVAVATLAFAATAGAQIIIGQTAGFTGAVGPGVEETAKGARLWIDHVNAGGGVNGQTITLLSMDDKFDPKLAAENARVLIEEKNVVALFLTRGTPHAQAVIPLLDKHGVALVGPSTGAMVLHQPVQKYVFNVRATYQREAERAIAHLASIGMTRIAVVYADDSFGTDGVAGANKGFAATKLTPSTELKFDRSKPDFSMIAPAVAKTNPQAVIFIASGQHVTDGIAALRKTGSQAQVVTLSNNASGGFVKSLGDNARGTIVTQVFPNERAAGYKMVSEAMQIGAKSGVTQLSPAMLEGYAAAKVMVEALRRAGPKPTREKVVAALNGLKKFDLGGLEVGYGEDDHTGLDFADLSIIGADGRFRR